jgi:hypothetical protein
MLHSADREALRHAVRVLENPGFAARLSHLVGTPIEKTLGLLPESLAASVHEASHQAIAKALDLAIASLANPVVNGALSARTHRVLSGLSGAVGGFWGAPALAIELPVSTVLMLRAIAAVAGAEGEDMDAVEARLACLEVFALGGRGAWDDGAETGYFAVRAALANTVAEAAHYLAQKRLVEGSAPALLRLITQVGTRFGITVSQKLAAQAVPILGAVGGASVNWLFMEHFQTMAQGHFSVRRLERRYGKTLIEAEYRRLRESW